VKHMASKVQDNDSARMEILKPTVVRVVKNTP